MPKDSLLFQAISLLSQHLADLEPLLHRTSCMNSEEREVVGILQAVQVFLDPNEDKEFIDWLKKAQDFFEMLGMAKWQRTELTDLGLRIGQRHKERVNMTENTTEAEIYATEEGYKEE